MSEPSFTRGRKWQVGFNVAIALASAFALVLMANYLSARHSWRANWAESSSLKLSPLTMRVLSNVTNRVKVIVFFQRGEPVFGSVQSLLKDYQLACPKLDVEVIDYRYPGRSEAIRQQYKLTTGAGEGSRVIFDCAGRVRVIGAGELSDFTLGPNREIRRSGFKGEQLFTSAILSVTAAKRSKAYFLGGHGEHSPESEDDGIGFRNFAKILSDADVDLAYLKSLPATDVPEDCSVLVIAGASDKFEDTELERLDRYLTQGGRMFVLFPPFVLSKKGPTGLERLMAKWNVQVEDTLVFDTSHGSASQGRDDVIATRFGGHPITKALLRSSIKFVFPRLVASRAAGAVRADAPKTTELIFTSDQGTAYGKIDQNGRGELELSGKIPLAVAVEKGGIQGVAGDKGATRIVVVGSSISFANLTLQEGANADFATLAFNWLLNRDVLLAEIPTRAIKEYTLTMTEKQMTTLRWVFLLAAPALALALGGLVWLRRRS